MTQNDEGNMLAPMWLFDHVAACIRDGKATEEMAQNVECLRGGMEAQAARIAELEAALERLDNETHELRGAYGCAAMFQERAEAAKAEVARLRDALSDALDAWDTHNETGDMMEGYWVSDARAALAQKEGGE